MTLIIAAVFYDALGRLTSAEQKQAKLTAFDLEHDPRGNGIQMHRVEKSVGFWTARVSQDIRLVIFKDGDTTILAHVDHHDAAYRWAERRKMVPHERSGAMQIVKILEVEEQAPALPHEPEAAPTAIPPRAIRAPFGVLSDDQLLDVGVPRDWLQAVRDTAEDDLFELLEQLPAEASEALLDYATGGKLQDHVVAPVHTADPYMHPDAQRRFRVIDNLEELKAALDQPFEKWAVFLHPAQRTLVERDWTGPARVSGSAGTGKTIVALHRAVHLARKHPNANVLLTTFSKPLAAALAGKRDILTEAEPELREHIVVRALDQAATELYTQAFGQPTRATSAQIRAAIGDAKKAGLGGVLTAEFLFEEWDELVDAWNVIDAESYATIPRLGRRTRLGSQQREAAWGVFTFIRQRLRDRRVITRSEIYAALTDGLRAGSRLPYDHVVVDEAQDLSVAQVRFLAALAEGRADALFLAGDIGQRIFHLPFSSTRLGLDTRGRSRCLKVNYRTSHQIRAAADRLLPASITDMDGVEEGRRGTVSVFDGPAPEIDLTANETGERDAVAKFIAHCLADGIRANEIGVLVRGEGQVRRARSAVVAAGLDSRDDNGIVITTMHGAKGLEFRAVAVIACDDDILPDPGRLATIGDIADMEAAYETERHLLYVACTRARDRLFVSAVTPGSEFLADLTQGKGK